MTETTHRDVGGDRGPRALCSGAESGVICTDDWLAVTCQACFDARHPDAPLCRRELTSGVRATAPGERRALTPEEINKGWKRL